MRLPEKACYTRLFRTTGYGTRGGSFLAAARSRHGSDVPPARHSLPWRRFATPRAPPRLCYLSFFGGFLTASKRSRLKNLLLFCCRERVHRRCEDKPREYAKASCRRVIVAGFYHPGKHASGSNRPPEKISSARKTRSSRSFALKSALIRFFSSGKREHI